MNVVASDAAALTGDHCNDLVLQIESSDWSNLLSENTAGALTAYALADLNSYVDMYVDPPSGPRISLERLDTIVSELPSGAVRQLHLQERIWNWLKDLIEQEVDAGRLAWLKELNISPGASRMGLYLLAVIFVLAAVAIVLNEARMARNSSRRKSLFRTANWPSTQSKPPADLQDVPLLDRPAMILTTVLNYLGHIPASFTHRQLLSVVAGLSPAQQHKLGSLALAAERIRFGGWQPEQQTIDRIVLDGVGLAEQLEVRKSQ